MILQPTPNKVFARAGDVLIFKFRVRGAEALRTNACQSLRLGAPTESHVEMNLMACK
jgi:hypothetical protein